MNDTLLHSALQESVDEVLEKMFFVRSFGDAQDTAGEQEFIARLSFVGEPSGWLVLCVTDQAARSVASDFLGEDDGDLSEHQIGEVICELANMICGSVLSRVERNASFHLAAPQLVPVGSQCFGNPVVGGEATATTHFVEIGNGRLKVLFQTERPAWSSTEEYGS